MGLPLDPQHAVLADEPRALRRRDRLLPHEVPDRRRAQPVQELLRRQALALVERGDVEVDLSLAQRPPEEAFVARRNEGLGPPRVDPDEDRVIASDEEAWTGYERTP